jgi:hypothetical protein
VSFGFVLAEKFKKIVEILFYFCLNKYGTVRDVFPTPDYPVKRTGFYYANNILNIYEYFNVLIVGTNRS